MWLDLKLARWLRQQALRFQRYLREVRLERVRRARQRADLELLLSLDDHTLADIGVTRSEVQGVLFGVLTWRQMGSLRDERRASAEVVRLERSLPASAARDLDEAA